MVYATGLAAFHAMMVRLNPKKIAIGDGYHGVHGCIKVLSRLSGLQQLDLDCDVSELGPGDVIHVETPLNPYGEARDLHFYAEKARKAGAWLTVDATFGPPPLQDPFAFGADMIMHSGTKYIGGHSDMLCGAVSVRPDLAKNGMIKDLLDERLVIGSVMGNMEGWLGLRSLRTLELRVTRQSASADTMVKWLSSQLGDESTVVGKLVEKIYHASLQEAASQEGSWLRKQMPRGYGPVFAILMKEMESAKNLPSKLKLFQHATSLGGVESLIEWRAMTDNTVDTRLLRVSIGVEGLEDLKDDLQQGLEKLIK